jgi:hypothetical protein
MEIHAAAWNPAASLLPPTVTVMRAYTSTAHTRNTPARNNWTPRKVEGRSRTPRKGQEKRARNRRVQTLTNASPLNRTPPLPGQAHILYYQSMKRKKRPSETPVLALWLFGGMLAFSPFLAPPASADIYRWEDESGVIHFTDDPSTIPAKYRGKSREILKTPPAAGQPSLSTMDAPSSSPGPFLSPRPSSGETPDLPALPQDDDATLAESSSEDRREGAVRSRRDEQSSRRTRTGTASFSPTSSPYRKYKRSSDRERLKALESGQSPVKDP